ncbi:MAG: response regulator [Proteobacteria bacterium]|nr:response regulator [Pseudomonadota bacterium]
MATVYLVDDDDGVRKALARALRESGFDVHAFESADAFLAGLPMHPRGCIVLDVSMPEIDGFQLQAQLAALGTRRPSCS